MTDMHTRTNNHHQIWRQVGWLTHVTKRFYPIGTPEPLPDPAGYSPMWELIENDPIDERPWRWEIPREG